MTAAVVQAPPTAWIPRARLVRRLMSAPDTPLVLIVAPAGYGKTSLLSEWSIEDRRPFAWVTLRDTDTGPADLAMTAPEAALLASSHGVDLSHTQLDSLVHRTEGWPAGLYLSALA